MMHWEEIASRWPEFSKKAHSNWNNLSVEQLNAVQGNRAELCKLIQSAYQYNEAKTENEIDRWLENLLGDAEDFKISDTNDINQKSLDQKSPDQKSLDQKLKENLDSSESIAERDEILGSPYHKGY